MSPVSNNLVFACRLYLAAGTSEQKLKENLKALKYDDREIHEAFLVASHLTTNNELAQSITTPADRERFVSEPATGNLFLPTQAVNEVHEGRPHQGQHLHRP